MRLRRSRLAAYKHCRMEQKKDNEGGTYTAYDSPSSFYAEMWAAGGKLQSEMYGSRLPNIRNLRLEGTYREVSGKPGKCPMRSRAARQLPSTMESVSTEMCQITRS